MSTQRARAAAAQRRRAQEQQDGASAGGAREQPQAKKARGPELEVGTRVIIKRSGVLLRGKIVGHVAINSARVRLRVVGARDDDDDDALFDSLVPLADDHLSSTDDRDWHRVVPMTSLERDHRESDGDGARAVAEQRDRSGSAAEDKLMCVARASTTDFMHGGDDQFNTPAQALPYALTTAVRAGALPANNDAKRARVCVHQAGVGFVHGWAVSARPFAPMATYHYVYVSWDADNKSRRADGDSGVWRPQRVIDETPYKIHQLRWVRRPRPSTPPPPFPSPPAFPPPSYAT